MRQVVALAVSLLLVACVDQQPVAPEDSMPAPESLDLNLSGSADESWVITAYYWDDGWIDLASWDASSLGPDVRITFNAWNWPPQYSAFQADFDNVYALGDLDLPQGLIDGFNDGVIDPIWYLISSPSTPVYEANGVLNVDIPFGMHSESPPPGNSVGGLHTDIVVHGEFDVQVDFSVNPEYHSTPNCSIALRIVDEYGYSAIMRVRSSYYQAQEHGPDLNIVHAWTPTDDLVGKLRITRTRAVMEVDIDIKPGSDPNCVNPNSRGRIAVAILTTDAFDPADVDVSTVTVGGVAPIRWSFNKDVSGDGLADLVFQFRTQDLKDAGLLTDGNTLTLTGALLDGTPIEGSDMVYLTGGPNCFD